MRLRLVTTLAVAAIVAAAVFATVIANPADGTPSRAQACTNCHPAAPTATTVSATPSTTTPAAGGTYTVTISLAGLAPIGDTGYWISNATGTPALSVFGGTTGTNQTSYTQTMTAPSTPGSYSYTVWCERGTPGNGEAKSTTYSITVPAPTAAITSLTPNHAQTGATVVINGSNLGTTGVVSFSGTSATTSAWSATVITCTVPAGLTAGAKSVTVTPSGGAASNGLAFTVDAATAPTAAITSLTPNHAQAGTAVVIAGTNLGVSGTVRFGTTVAATSAWSATSVTAVAPVSLASVTSNVTVTPTGGAASNGLAFTLGAPTVLTAAITSLTPSSGLVGVTVVINGSNLGTSGVVSFSGTSATTSAWSATSISCTVPAGLTAGAKNVTVTPSGAAASNVIPFTVTVPAPLSGNDTTAPTTTARLVGGDHWHGGVVTVSLTATDNTGGVGVAAISYSIAGGAPVTVIGSRATVAMRAGLERHEGDGDHAGDRDRAAAGARTITYYATDAAGNVELAHTLTVNARTGESSTRQRDHRGGAAPDGDRD